MTRTKRTVGLVIFLLLGLVSAFAAVLGYTIWQSSAETHPPANDGSPEASTELPRDESSLKNAASQDAQFRKLVVGTWQDDYQGKRTVTLREDGTGTMVVELSGLKASLVAPRLTFTMEWSVAAGRLKKHSLGGEPAGKVSMILKTMGDTVDEEILELTEDRLLLLDQDGKTKYDWRRR